MQRDEVRTNRRGVLAQRRGWVLGFGADDEIACLEAAANMLSNVGIVACVALLNWLGVIPDLELCQV